MKMINAIPERNLPVLNFVYINLTICSTYEHQTVQTMLMVNNHLQCTLVRTFSQKPPDFVNSFILTEFAYDCNVFSFLRDINWKITKNFFVASLVLSLCGYNNDNNDFSRLIQNVIPIQE